MKNKFKLDLKESSSNFQQSSKMFSEKEASRFARLPSESRELSLTLQSDFMNSSYMSNAISSFHFDDLRRDVQRVQNNIERNKNEKIATQLYLDELREKSQKAVEQEPYLTGNYEDVRRRLNNVASKGIGSRPDAKIKSGPSTQSERECFNHFLVQKRNFTKAQSKTNHKVSHSPDKNSPSGQQHSNHHHSHFLSASKHLSRSQSEAPVRANLGSLRRAPIHQQKKERITETKKRFKSSSQTKAHKRLTDRQKILKNYQRVMNMKPKEVKVYNTQSRDPRTGLPKRVRIRPLFLWLGERVIATGDSYTLVKMITKAD